MGNRKKKTGKDIFGLLKNKYKYWLMIIIPVVMLIARLIYLSEYFSHKSDFKDFLMWMSVVEMVFIVLLLIWIWSLMRKRLKEETRAKDVELESLHKKEQELKKRYDNLSSRKEFLEAMARTLPAGYHRCTTDHAFRLTFASNSFTEVTGYTMEQLNEEHGGSYMGIVAPEDREYFLSLAPKLERDGFIHCAYRMRRRDGSIRWVQDSTQYVERDGESYYQCALSDVHDIVLKQEKLARQANFLDVMEKNMPGCYHRCADAEGWPFLYISSSFCETTGWSKEEIETEFDNLFINMVLPEDIPLCAGIIDDVNVKGYSNAMYRIKKKGGGYLWVADSTIRVTSDNESYFHGVLADITNQISEMDKAKQEALASSQAKSTFLFNISHDIRTPINAIKGFSDIIERNADNKELVTETIGKIKHAGDSLIMLVNDVLDISRIERGKEELNLQPMDLATHGKNLYEMFALEMSVKGIDFNAGEYTLSDCVYCDELKLTRIIMNMLSNAKKFTPSGGTVTFGATRLEKNDASATYRFFVRDTGIGMSKEFQKRAFEQFERERTSTESKIAGSGLGLSIIKLLVDLMGGSVEIESELGKGTEISVTLTLALAGSEKTTEHPQNTNNSLTGKRVMIVEDNDFNREIARYVFESMGIFVDEAENGAECIEKLLNKDADYYDLIIMDIQMPVMDGYTATIEIRNLKDEKRSQIPIIAMTANSFEEDKKKCAKVGMNGHIGKPIDFGEITEILEKYIGKKE